MKSTVLHSCGISMKEKSSDANLQQIHEISLLSAMSYITNELALIGRVEREIAMPGCTLLSFPESTY